MKPHVCPKCNGDGRFKDPRYTADVQCLPCKGSGIVWEPHGWEGYVPPPLQSWTDKWRFIDGEWSPVPTIDVGLSDRTEEDS